MELDTVGEDAELVVRLHGRLRAEKRDYRISFVAEPVSWSEAPATWRILGRQRRRWHRGLAEILSAHHRMVGNPRYGRVGLVALPYYFLFELLAPFVELTALVVVPVGLLVGAVNLAFMGWFALVAYLYGMVVSLTALLLEEISFHRYRRWEDLVRGMVAAVLENVGYRQILAWFQIQGAWRAWRGKASTWGVMQRTGFDTPTGPQP
jgi:cellulose synthase/poly-beta-1,6-N-acetylglucosamine synthase-like glycosyltransferase